jgi:hypothetical protein
VLDGMRGDDLAGSDAAQLVADLGELLATGHFRR